jgi:dTDP-4-dehydrorhamnose reductase
VCEDLRGVGRDVIELSRGDLEVTDLESVTRVISRCEPHVVINCTAYNAVDAAETETAQAYVVNAVAPGLLARAAAAANAVFVHYGTDFVFDGCSQAPYVETDPTNPLSAYGLSKLAGEIEVRRRNEAPITARTTV